jgi:heptaprenyl diphosphate synthase
MQLQTNKIAKLGLLLALALVLSYVEQLVPVPLGIPGAKLGLPNLVILLLLYTYGWKEALLVSVMRIFLSGFLFGGMSGILYSMAGAALSFLVMLLAKKCRIFSMTAVSILGGVFHNIGQLMVDCLVLNGFSIIYYLPLLLVCGLLAGGLNGILATQLYKRGLL